MGPVFLPWPVQFLNEVDAANEVADGNVLAKVDGGFEQSCPTSHDGRVGSQLKVGDAVVGPGGSVGITPAVGGGVVRPRRYGKDSNVRQQPVESGACFREDPAVDGPTAGKFSGDHRDAHTVGGATN